MKILIISKYATPVTYPRFFRLGRELVKKGGEVLLVCSTSNHLGTNDIPSFRGIYKKDVIDGVNVIWFKGPKTGNRGISRILSWVLFELQCLPLIFRNFDVVYTSSLSLLSVYNGYIHKYLFKRKWILEIRDVWPATPILLGGFSEKNIGIRFLSFTEKLGYKHADILTGTMPNLAYRVNEELGIDREVHCLPQGLDTELFTTNSADIGEDFKNEFLPSDRFIVGYVGTININNPLSELCELIESQTEELKQKYWFIILGRGELKADLQQRFAKYENVVFPEPVDKKYMASILQEVDVGYDSIAPGLATYGLSRNKWIDYFFNGCPVVCVYEGYKSMINTANFGKYVGYGEINDLRSAFEYFRKLSKDEREVLNKRGRDYLLQERSFPALASKLLSWI